MGCAGIGLGYLIPRQNLGRPTRSCSISTKKFIEPTSNFVPRGLRLGLGMGLVGTERSYATNGDRRELNFKPLTSFF